jgi:hypothetical protein
MPAKSSARKRQTQFSKLGVFSIGLLLILPLPHRVDATVLNWPSAPGWTAGVPAAGQTVTQSFTAASPNDVTVSINNNGLGPQGATWQGGYPTINSTTKTGGFSGVNGLQLSIASESSTSSFIRTTITFATPVAGLTFQLWDVDAAPGSFADKISSIQANAVGGGIVGPTSVTSAVPGYNVISGSGLSTVVLGTSAANDSTNQGTVDITFSGQITQFSFDYSNNDSGLGAQGIAIGPLTYAIVPESNTFFCVVLLCAVAIGLDGCRRRNNASS